MRREMKIVLEEINFSEPENVIEYLFLDKNRIPVGLYFSITQFERWLEENDYLTICDEYFDLWASEFTQTTKKISSDDFFSEDQYQEYKLRLAEEFFLSHVIEL